MLGKKKNDGMSAARLKCFWVYLLFVFLNQKKKMKDKINIDILLLFFPQAASEVAALTVKIVNYEQWEDVNVQSVA